jgi:hypothetical protein
MEKGDGCSRVLCTFDVVAKVRWRWPHPSGPGPFIWMEPTHTDHSGSGRRGGGLPEPAVGLIVSTTVASAMGSRRGGKAARMLARCISLYWIHAHRHREGRPPHPHAQMPGPATASA